MKSLSQSVRRFVKGEEGATLVEYALLVALIAVVCIAAISSLGGAISEQFSDIEAAITG